MELTALAARRIPAPAELIYTYIADFGQHHHRFLPDAFGDFRVEEGGVGAGTVNSFTMTLGGQTRAYRTRIEEPEPGRVLTETATDGSSHTTFTVTPDGDGTRVQIETTWRGAGGVAGIMERLVAPAMLRRVYAEELERLDAYARAEIKGPAVPRTAQIHTN
ncbi:MAG TPA: SRPBCC family protein [Candidatus Limnocylindria bacterium]|nr:SRPBCC family protein [Candidatus Limnocylindria bacterium]